MENAKYKSKYNNNSFIKFINKKNLLQIIENGSFYNVKNYSFPNGLNTKFLQKYKIIDKDGNITQYGLDFAYASFSISLASCMVNAQKSNPLLNLYFTQMYYLDIKSAIQTTILKEFFIDKIYIDNRKDPGSYFAKISEKNVQKFFSESVDDLCFENIIVGAYKKSNNELDFKKDIVKTITDGYNKFDKAVKSTKNKIKIYNSYVKLVQHKLAILETMKNSLNKKEYQTALMVVNSKLQALEDAKNIPHLIKNCKLNFCKNILSSAQFKDLNDWLQNVSCTWNSIIGDETNINAIMQNPLINSQQTKFFKSLNKNLEMIAELEDEFVDQIQMY